MLYLFDMAFKILYLERCNSLIPCLVSNGDHHSFILGRNGDLGLKYIMLDNKGLYFILDKLSLNIGIDVDANGQTKYWFFFFGKVLI